MSAAHPNVATGLRSVGPQCLVSVEHAWDGENPLEAEDRSAAMASFVATALAQAGLGVGDNIALGTTRCRTVFAVTDPDAAIAVIKATLDGSVFADYRGISVLDEPAT